MNKTIISLALVAGFALPLSSAYAAEGAATGNATSTPAGPASDSNGPSKSGSMSNGSMSNGSMSKNGGMMKSPGMATGTSSDGKGTATGGPSGGNPGRN